MSGRTPNDLERIIRFHVKVLPNGCWEWKGAMVGPYGIVTYHGKQYYAHILIYRLTKGYVISTMDHHHKCLYKRCVNPDHVEPLTKSKHHTIEPSTRKNNKCWSGHEMTEENTYLDPKKGYKLCRACRAISSKEASDNRRRKRLRLKLSLNLKPV